MINQIMFIDFKAMKLFWRKCFVTKWASHLESLLFFTNHHSMNCHLCKKLRWPKTCIRTEAACHGWQRFGELCGWVILIWNSRIRHLIECLVWRIVWYAAVWFWTVESDCLVWRIVWYGLVWFGTVEFDCLEQLKVLWCCCGLASLSCSGWTTRT